MYVCIQLYTYLYIYISQIIYIYIHVIIRIYVYVHRLTLTRGPQQAQITDLHSGQCQRWLDQGFCFKDTIRKGIVTVSE